MQPSFITRVWRAARNDVAIYQELKTNPGPGWEPIVAMFGPLLINLVILLAGGLGLLSFVGFGLGIVAYLFLVGWGWLLGAKMFKGSGSLGEVFRALAYAVCLPSLLGLIPNQWIGLAAGLWGVVLMSSALRETLGIGRGPTFFILVSWMVFAACAFFAYGLIIVAIQQLLGIEPMAMRWWPFEAYLAAAQLF